MDASALEGPVASVASFPVKADGDAVRLVVQAARDRANQHQATVELLREDLVVLLHHRLLTEQWPVLRCLISPYIREVWEDAFPELAHEASAAA